MSPKVILVTGASSGFGALTVRALADAKHLVYAGMRDIRGRNADAASTSLVRSRGSSGQSEDMKRPPIAAGVAGMSSRR